MFVCYVHKSYCILKSCTPCGWMNSYRYFIHTYVYVYLIGFIFYSLFAHMYRFFSLAHSLTSLLTFYHFTVPHTHTLTHSLAHTHTINKPLLFAICFFISCFLFHKLALRSHQWLWPMCIKVSKVKVWSCHDTTRKYNEWGKWHICVRSVRNARIRSQHIINKWCDFSFFLAFHFVVLLCTHPVKVPFRRVKIMQAIRLGPNTSHQD